MATREELEAKARADYAVHRDRLVKVNRISGYRGSDSVDIELEPPALVRVLATSDDDLTRWMGSLQGPDDWLDPVWDVEPVEPRPKELEGLRSFWVYATSYHEDGRVEPGDVVQE